MFEISRRIQTAVVSIVLVFGFSVTGLAQGNVPTVATARKAISINRKAISIKQIDNVGLRKALTPANKPLLVNFWATWCEPCREEFPDLVKLDAEYKGKIDFITISLDELSEIDRDVPKFLAEMKAEMPAYLLKALDDDAAITSVSKEWSGALPLTVLYDPAGKQIYYRQGKVKLETVRTELDKLLGSPKPVGSVAVMDFVKIKDGRRDGALFFYENNWKIYREAALKKGVIESFELVEGVPDPAAAFDIVLITRYSSDEQRANSEKNFEPILKEIRPGGAVLKNEIKPEAFRQNVFVRIVRTRFEKDSD